VVKRIQKSRRKSKYLVILKVIKRKKRTKDFPSFLFVGVLPVGNGCKGWRWVRGMPLDMICGVGQGGAYFANSLMGRSSRLP
jgi:hypothetical protein